MAAQDIAAALQRAESVFARRPEAAVHDDAAGMVRWDGGTRMVTRHANGKEVLTDMPTELGGTGDQVSPGWMVRAGFAACTATAIAMIAARDGIALQSLDVQVKSRSDSRGLLRMTDEHGQRVYPGPRSLEMEVRIAGEGLSAERLRALVEEAQACSPMGAVIQDAMPVVLRIEAQGA
jgi:uncharacterized OsmC-like protein